MLTPRGRGVHLASIFVAWSWWMGCASERAPTGGPGQSGAGNGATQATGVGGGAGEGGGGEGGAGEGGAGEGGAPACATAGEACGEEGICVQVVDVGATSLECASGDGCLPDSGCGESGVCVLIVDGDGATVVCADGEPGDPCAAPDDCASGVCEAVVSPSGVQSLCE